MNKYKYTDGFSTYTIEGLRTEGYQPTNSLDRSNPPQGLTTAHEGERVVARNSCEEIAENLQHFGRVLNGSREICTYCDNDITDLEGKSCPKCGAPRDECGWERHTTHIARPRLITKHDTCIPVFPEDKFYNKGDWKYVLAVCLFGILIGSLVVLL